MALLKTIVKRGIEVTYWRISRINFELENNFKNITLTISGYVDQEARSRNFEAYRTTVQVYMPDAKAKLIDGTLLTALYEALSTEPVVPEPPAPPELEEGEVAEPQEEWVSPEYIHVKGEDFLIGADNAN